MLRRLNVLLVILLLALALAAQRDKSAPDKKGHFLDENTYNNPALGMTLKLPGAWEFFTQQAKKDMGIEEKETHDSSCTGPLCRSDIDVSLITKAEPVATASIFLRAYKLEPQYLDRRRYPLKLFAQSLMTGGVGGSGWTAI